MAPAGTAPAIVAALNREIAQIVNLPDVEMRLAVDGVEPAAPNTPAQFGAIFAREFDKFEKFFKVTGIKL